MKRYFSSLPCSSVSPAATSDAMKKQRAAISQLEINAQLVTLDKVLEPPIIMNDASPAKAQHVPAKWNNNVDPVNSPELHKLRLRAILRGAQCIAQIREGRLKSEAEFMNEYYAIARELQLTKAQCLQWNHQVHHLVPRCCGGSDEPSNLAPFTFSSHFLLHVLLATFFSEHEGLQITVQRMSSAALDPFRLVADPELLSAADDARARALIALSARQTGLASKGLHNWQLKHSDGGAPPSNATRCQICFMIHTEIAKATKKQLKNNKTIQKCILQESRHQMNLVPGTNKKFCEIPTGNQVTGARMWKCWCRDGQGGIRASNHNTKRSSIN